VPPDVLLRCLEKAPERRPQNVDELAEALRNCFPGDPWLPERAGEWWDTHLPRSTSKVKL
jgi:hypothetical protein